ncbi:MAG TPA: hypothetical protein VMU99_09370 [Acidimicrobiales bacterium]|nr:hypothetical protein [Acidimicrobiales bacterium]
MHTSSASQNWIDKLSVKIVVSLLFVAFADLHQRANSRPALAVYGGLSGISRLATLVRKVQLSASTPPALKGSPSSISAVPFGKPVECGWEK